MIRIWNATTGALDAQLDGHVGAVLGVAWSADGAQLASAGSDGTFRVWDMRNAATELVLESVARGGDAPFTRGGAIGVQFSPDGATWLAVSGTTIAWRKVDHSPVVELDSGGDLMSAAESPDGKSVVASGVGVMSRWTLRTRARIWSTPIAGHRIYDVSWSPDGSEIAVAGEPQVAAIYDAQGQLLRRLVGHERTINRAGFSPDGTHILTASDDHTARIWDAATGAERLRLAHPDRVMSAAWDRASRRIATAGWDHHIRVWDATTGTLLRDLDGGAVQFLDVAFGPGDTIASAGRGGDVALWDLATGKTRHLEGHWSSVTTVAWSPDNALLATAGSDGAVRIWDPGSGLELALHRHEGEVMSVRWTPDGEHVVTASVDGRVRIWEVRRDERPADELVATVRAYAPYWLVDDRLVRSRAVSTQ